MQASEEIKSKLDIVDILREYIQVKPAGTSFRALCPFHHEKSPSLMISPEKQIWHCFGCGKGGDIFSFVMEMEGLSFPEALRQLAVKAGVRVERQDPKLASQKNRLLDIVELSAKYYQKVLADSKLAEGAREYLEKRGLAQETIDEWRIGFSTDSWDDLIKFLIARGFKENDIFSAGLSVKREKMSGFYNRFRGRIMFPISDINGNVVGFSARILPEKDDGKTGKYINSPQSVLYDKSRILFGLDKAKMEIRRQDLAVVTEGQMDVITAHQNGFKNVVASSGTALTQEQIKLLQRYTNNIAFALDADKAGQMATERGDSVVKEADYKVIESEDRFGQLRRYVDPRSSYQISLKVVEIPNGKDMDECIKNDPEEWRKAVSGAKNIMQYFFDKTFGRLDMKKIEDRRQAAKELLPKIAKLGDAIEQDIWIKKLSEAIDVKEYVLSEMLSKLGEKTVKSGPEPVAVRVNSPKAREEKLSEILLALAMKYPEFLGSALNRLEPDHVVGPQNKGLYRSLIIFYNNLTDSENSKKEDSSETALNYDNFSRWLAENASDGDLIRHLEMLAILGDRDFVDYDQERAKTEMMGAILFLKKNYLSLRMREVEKMIAESERAGDQGAISALMKDFKLLSEELNNLQK